MSDIVKCQTKKWGNSIGVLLPKKFVSEHDIKPHQEVIFEIKDKKSNVLRELFGAGKEEKITKKEFLETRKLFESKF